MLDKLTEWIERGAAQDARQSVIDGTRQGVREAMSELTAGRLSLGDDEPLYLPVPVEEIDDKEDEVLEKPAAKKTARKTAPKKASK